MQIYRESDYFAVKYWKFLRYLCGCVLMLAVYTAVAIGFVVVLGPYGGGVFFAVTLVLFLLSNYLYPASDDIFNLN